MSDGRFGSWGQAELPEGCSLLWSLQRWLWHHRDTRLCGFAATHLSWAIQALMVWNSLPLGLGGSRGKSELPAQAQAETGKPKATQDREQTRHPWQLFLASLQELGTSGRTGKHCWDLLGALPTLWHYGVVPAGISYP